MSASGLIQPLSIMGMLIPFLVIGIAMAGGAILWGYWKGKQLEESSGSGGAGTEEEVSGGADAEEEGSGSGDQGGTSEGADANEEASEGGDEGEAPEGDEEGEHTETVDAEGGED